MHNGPRLTLISAAGLAILITSRLVHSHSDDLVSQSESFARYVKSATDNTVPAKGSHCQDVPALILSKANLTNEGISLLPSICWHEVARSRQQELASGLSKRSGVPPGVQCEKTSW